ncbi:hypothetical protein CH300_00225 [Rhodococcus sp. 15-1154-1]|nr:hypothetical protein CH300_00225 [Rhodococcus sp. 15-1154-1]
MDAMSGMDVLNADVWWAKLPPERKCQIHRWIEPGAAGGHAPVRGQIELPIPVPTDTEEEVTADDRNDRRDG